MKIMLHGALARQFGSEFEIDTGIPAVAIEGLSRQLPGWPVEMLIDAVGFDTEEKLKSVTSEKVIHLVPAIHGGGGLAKIGIGLALIAVSFIPGLGTFLGASVASMLFMTGAGIALSGIMQMFVRAPTIDKSEDPPPSKYFGVDKNTTAIGTYRPLLYGRQPAVGHWLSIQVDAKSLVKGRFPETLP